jgi:hypothetical protein
MPAETNDKNDPSAAYARCLVEERGHLARLRRWLRLLIWLRIADLVLCVVLAGEACSHGGHLGLAAAASALAFVGLSIAIAVAEQRGKRHEAVVRYCEEGQARVQGRRIQGAPDGQRFADAAHPYAADLDIFGPASVFALLCTARTGTGQATLAGWLTHAAPVDDIAQRQRAVAELRARLPLRRDLWLAGGTVHERVREEALEQWLSGPVTRISPAQRIATGLVGALGIFVFYAFANPAAISGALAVVLVQRLLARKYRPLTQAVEAKAFQRADELRVIARLAERLRREQFFDPYLLALMAGIADEGKPASRHIFHLVRLVAWLESRRNPMFGLFAGLLLLPEQLCFAIEAWRARHATAAMRWLATIGEMEALCSLATFAFEHPSYPFPHVLQQAESPSLQAVALGHPLIPADARVTNDVRLDASCHLLVVTGSNMSGKSTLLRTVGVNAVLALAGAPVCAASMTLTPLRIGASLRAQDSLEAGVSRFFAEIKRLHAILSMAAQTKPPVLFLLDEILNGTNSQDRREGAEAVIRLLLERGAIGLLTTHDLALSTLADTQSSPGANVHFQDTLEGDRLLFDYSLRPGVVTRRNALDLMRLIGIDVKGNVNPPGESG